MNTDEVDAMLADEKAVERTTDDDLPKPETWGAVRSFRDLQTTGLLWLINSVVFHPRGFALGMVPGDDDPDGTGPYFGWNLLGDGTEPWTMGTDPINDERFRAVEEFFAAHRKDTP